MNDLIIVDIYFVFELVSVYKKVKMNNFLGMFWKVEIVILVNLICLEC